ncbi:hypothetical protein SEA_CHEESETOUCH_34 [Gordonia phage CheeseTouch]
MGGTITTDAVSVERCDTVNVWRIEEIADGRYRFHGIPSESFGQVRIEGAVGSIPIPGPVGTPFEVDLPAGEYTISWHWMVGKPDDRSTGSFAVPPQGAELFVSIED